MNTINEILKIVFRFIEERYKQENKTFQMKIIRPAMCHRQSLMDKKALKTDFLKETIMTLRQKVITKKMLKVFIFIRKLIYDKARWFNIGCYITAGREFARTTKYR
jgi:hypothetical protein